MKRILKNICASALITGLCFGTAAISRAAWSGMNYKNECNTSSDLPSVGAVLVDNASDRAPDGTAYIKAAEAQADWLKNTADDSDMAFEMPFSTKAIETFCTWETDIKFLETGSGFSIRNNSGSSAGNLNTTIVYGNSNTLRFSKVDNSKGIICDAELNQWYHIKVVGVYGSKADMHMTISKYNSDGSSTTVVDDVYPGDGSKGDIVRNDKAPTRFVFAPNTCVDNVTAYEMSPAAITLTTDTEKNANGAIDMNAGESVSFGNTLYADAGKNMEMTGFSVIYELLNADKTDNLISDEISITPEGGVLAVSGAAEAQSFVVRVKCVDFPEVYDDIAVNVESVPMIEFLGAGFKDDTYTEIVQLKFKQNYENEGDISFIAAVYNADGALVDVYNKTLAYRDQKEGELFVTLNQQLSDGFNPDTWTIKVFAWSKTIN